MTELFYEVPRDMLSYSKGHLLVNLTLSEARSLECNRCGACCDGLSDGVKKDEATGLPLFVWGSNAPDDLYVSRYGKQLLQPIVMGDGGPVIGDTFEVDADGKTYTSFSCSQLKGPDQKGCFSCALYGNDKPEDPSVMRPRNCGEFPVFGLDVDAAIIEGVGWIPATGALPLCTWYGIRVVGPWRDTEKWRAKWEVQQDVDTAETAVVP